MADFQSIYNAIGNAKCSHDGCTNEPVMFIYSRLTKRSSAQCLQHGVELLRRTAYSDLEELMLNVQSPSESTEQGEK